MNDEPSTRVEEPIRLELTPFEQTLSDVLDYWRGEARFWRVWAVFATGVAAGGWALAGWALLWR